jgi:hypothetical protein
MKQTAVEWLLETMLKPLSQWPEDIRKQAKEMEKEQIIDAIIISEKEHIIQGNVYPPQFVVDKAERYYKQKYGGGEQ